jgi:molecular chaperone HscB
MPETHFERLGLPVRFGVDPAEIERNYLARSRALHPDFHGQASDAEQRASLELTAALNEAYAVLRDPFRRAEYLLSLHGGPSASEVKEMAPAFLEEMLELRMEIEELRETGGADSPERLEMETRLNRRNAALLDELTRHFVRLEKTAEGKPILLDVRRTLNAARYIQGLLRDLRAD